MVTNCKLSVLLGDSSIGEIEETAEGLIYTYKHGVHPTDLSVSMPQTVRKHLPPLIGNWIDGLLPDDQQIRNAWASARGVDSDPMSLLSTDIGNDCAGAVRFMTHGAKESIPKTRNELLHISTDELNELISDIAKSGGLRWTTGLRAPISLAGWQPKTALRLTDDGWVIPVGSEPTSHIFKPQPEQDWPNLAVNEWLCLSVASLLGLTAAKPDIRTFGGFDTLIVERFDRHVVDGSLARMHVEDFCQATGRPPGKKYEAHGGPSAAEICALLRFHNAMQPEIGELDVRRFVDYLIFNWLVSNTDNHGKNHGLIHTTSALRLAPLYDVCSLLTVRSDYEDCYMSIRVGGEDRVGSIGADQWGQLAEEIGLVAVDVVNRVKTLARRIPDAVNEAVKQTNRLEYVDDLASTIHKAKTLGAAMIERAVRCCA